MTESNEEIPPDLSKHYVLASRELNRYLQGTGANGTSDSLEKVAKYFALIAKGRIMPHNSNRLNNGLEVVYGSVSPTRSGIMEKTAQLERLCINPLEANPEELGHAIKLLLFLGQES